ncbi:hypothetical protein LEP1GSC125_0150 [Leptospira mayottensis 200901122]|uniref:Uncharacterized protein n=1 Tax=Leptospira mayottensis 200901122 TaxID=1193010 RepID=A0AA87SWF6_9LEPT|nr:hypothetical protein LEP1GSC125_0150 [Leptospira mayottensis 200901122]
MGIYDGLLLACQTFVGVLYSEVLGQTFNRSSLKLKRLDLFIKGNNLKVRFKG